MPMISCEVFASALAHISHYSQPIEPNKLICAVRHLVETEDIGAIQLFPHTFKHRLCEPWSLLHHALVVCLLWVYLGVRIYGNSDEYSYFSSQIQHLQIKFFRGNNSLLCPEVFINTVSLLSHKKFYFGYYNNLQSKVIQH